jgi:two-component system, OmpR family, response regulator RegX3
MRLLRLSLALTEMVALSLVAGSALDLATNTTPHHRRREQSNNAVTTSFAIRQLPDDLSPHRILVVQNPGPTSVTGQAFATALRDEGYLVDVVTGAAECLERMSDIPDLVVLESLQPGMRWTELCRRIRAVAEVPILLGIRVESELEAVLAFELGVTGYLSQPSRTKELVARARASLRPNPSPPVVDEPASGSTNKGVQVHGGLEIDLIGREVKIDGLPVYLARREFDLLAVLTSPPGLVRTRKDLIDQVWAGRRLEGSRTLDTHIRRLRLKLEKDPAAPRLLITVRGVGFRFDDGLGKERDRPL